MVLVFLEYIELFYVHLIPLCQSDSVVCIAASSKVFHLLLQCLMFTCVVAYMSAARWRSGLCA